MAKGEKSTTVLILDDEPEYAQWVQDFLESNSLQCEFVRTLSEALKALTTKEYRLLLVDMNVPGVESASPEMRASHPIVQKYPGLILAIDARNKGYGAHSVIAYTVHNDESIEAELNKLHCRYVLKGRPEVLKRVIMSSLRPPKN